MPSRRLYPIPALIALVDEKLPISDDCRRKQNITTIRLDAYHYRESPLLLNDAGVSS